MSRHHQGGFTIIEVVVVVAIVAVLAAIAIPAFTRESAKVKGESETGPMLAEIASRQGQAFTETGAYVSSSGAETATHPTAPSTTPVAWGSPTGGWATLRMVPTQTSVRCAYVTIAGAAGTGPSGSSIAATYFGFTGTQPGPWYYALARCNMDGVTGADDKDSWYFLSSANSTLQNKYNGR